MKIIFAKLRSVTRYGVAVFLAVVSCFSAVAEVECIPGTPYQDVDGTWWVTISCSGDFSSSAEVRIDQDDDDDDDSCTNCTAMSVAECNAIKTSLSDEILTIYSQVENARGDLSESKSFLDQILVDLKELTDEGDSFFTIDNHYFASAGSAVERKEMGAGLPTGAWNNPSSSSTAALMRNGNNAIYNYYNESVKEHVGGIQGNVEQAKAWLNILSDDLDGFYNTAIVLENVVYNMNCQACPSSSGGGSGGGSGGTTPSGCPCSEYINGVKNAVENCYLKLTEIKSKLVEIKDKMDEWDKLLKGFKAQLDTIAHGVAYIGTNFLHAVQLTDLQGTQIKMAELDKLLHDSINGSFKQNEYAKLSWFSRIEYLLGSIAGVFSVTNKEANISDSSITEAYSGVADQKDSVQSDVDTLQGKFDTLHQTFKDFFSSFKSAYTGAGNSSTSFNLFDSWFDGKGLVVDIDGTVCQVARTITSLLWTLSFSVILYNIILYGVKYFAFVFKFWLAQITQFAK